MASYNSGNVYNVDYSKPGLVLIINNQNFVRTEERKGSEKDVDSILDTFENLNFKTRKQILVFMKSFHYVFSYLFRFVK